ncbi:MULTISPECIES: hypothetical protein [Sorangium]|nr:MULTISPECIES: hypothetical protein [Sorangium]
MPRRARRRNAGGGGEGERERIDDVEHLVRIAKANTTLELKDG